MKMPQFQLPEDNLTSAFVSGKTTYTLLLLYHFLEIFNQCGAISIHPAKSMLGIVHEGKKIAWITQLGKKFVHIVFPFPQAYPDQFCFQKIAQVPGDADQFNHHLRIEHPEDINPEVLQFMRLSMQ